jgi:hypothetical protein
LQPLLALAIGQQPVVADLHKVRRQKVPSQPPDELGQPQFHRLVPRAVGLIFVVDHPDDAAEAGPIADWPGWLEADGLLSILED